MSFVEKWIVSLIHSNIHYLFRLIIAVNSQQQNSRSLFVLANVCMYVLIMELNHF